MMGKLMDKEYIVESNSHEGNLDSKYKKSNGIFYTDLELSNAIVEFLKIPKNASIIDPCCGMGSFLFALKKNGYKHLFGCDFDEQTVNKCKKALNMRNIKCIDTLGNSGENILAEIKKQRFDYVIGNPPYAPISGDTKLKSYNGFNNLVKSSGNNLFVAALYRAFEICKAGGMVSVIIPKNLLHISSYKIIRENLLRNKRIVSIIELGIHFKAVRGEQIVLTFQNCEAQANDEIKFYRYDKGKIEYMSSVPQSYYKNEIIVFTGDDEVPIYDKLKNSYPQLGEVCSENIHRGHDKSKDAVTGKQIRKFGFKNRNIPDKGNQIFIQNIFSAEAGITASFAGDLKPAETVTIVKMENEQLCKYILGLLHSRVCNYFLIRFEFNNSRLTIHTDAKYLNQIPIVVDNIAMEDVINIVNKMEETEYMSAEWFKLNESLNAIVYDIYKISDEDREYIEAEMRKISASKWYGEKVCTA